MIPNTKEIETLHKELIFNALLVSYVVPRLEYNVTIIIYVFFLVKVRNIINNNPFGKMVHQSPLTINTEAKTHNMDKFRKWFKLLKR